VILKPPRTKASDIPWPGNQYIIVDKGSGKAIHLLANIDKVILQPVHWTHKDKYQPYIFTCVEGDGWFGFYEEFSRQYLGYDENGSIRASPEFTRSECFATKVHPSGGYQLLMPTNGPSLAMMMVPRDSGELLARLYGETLWDFVKV
jgi:hypothetical protein